MTRRHPVSIILSALAFILALHASPPLRADPPADNPGSPVDSYLQNSMQGLRIPGLSVAVVRNGASVLARGYGWANVEVDAAASPGSVFEIGNISKQFTAAAIMLLVERRKISLDDELLMILPELPQSWRNVTLRHLLTHTSGLPSYTSVPGFHAARRADIGRKAILDSIANLPLRFQPGEKWSVSPTD
jgi:D-alanyl-D-alanine carboxypeptidase